MKYQAIHNRIRESAEKTHAEPKACLTDILNLEGWHLDSLDIPDYLLKTLVKDE